MMSRAKSGLAVFTFLLTTLSPLFAYAVTYPHAVLQKPVVSCVNGAAQITLTWNKPLNSTAYSVFRNKLPWGWTNVSSAKTSNTFVEKNATAGATYQYQEKTFYGTAHVAYSGVVSVVAPNCAVSSVPPPPAPSPTPPPPPPVSGTTFSAYITGYGWPDNTPPSAEISDGVIHSSAGGTGTYTDPITIAVGHSIISGKDILDYPKGTKFYIPALRRYFIAEDTCGDGNSPQNGPCHTGFQGHVWLDAWVGGQNQNSSSVLACEDTITDIHTVIQNPSSNYAVVSGPVFNGTCSSLYSETASTI